MEIGVGLDPTLGLNWDQQREVSKEAARLGYRSIWTPEGNGQDSFHLCVQRWQATTEVAPEGLTTGIAVSPVMYRTPLSFAMEGGSGWDSTRWLASLMMNTGETPVNWLWFNSNSKGVSPFFNSYTL